jgi:anaerobic ribonucleoside-triphosphate reductase activating protein
MNVLTVTTPDIENGLGYRVTIWFAGCPHHCPGCHNKHTWDYNQGTPLMDKTVLNKIYENVDKEYIKGITLSGGDPLGQSDESLQILLKFLKEFKEQYPNKDIWIYSGDIYENLMQHPLKQCILSFCDTLVDGPFIETKYKRDLPFRGSSNQRIINLK